MWYGTEFGNQSETDGGGFLNNTNAEDPNKKQAKRHQSVVPVVVRQIRDCREDEFELFGMPTQILCIVGILQDFEVQSTKATYNIQDHTGTIKAVFWLDSDSENTPKLPAVKEGCYVQLFGSLRTQDKEKNIMILRMFLVEDANIVTSHLLQVIHTRLQAEYISKNPVPVQIQDNNPGVALANSMTFFDGAPAQTGLSTMQDKVFKILQSDNSPQGINRQAIMKQFPPNQQRDVNAALEFLIGEGHAYSTIDNDHFKPTAY